MLLFRLEISVLITEFRLILTRRTIASCDCIEYNVCIQLSSIPAKIAKLYSCARLQTRLEIRFTLQL